MSYSSLGGVGSYYTFSPHEVLSGLGCGCSGMGCSCSGLGALDFSGSAVWNDWLTGQGCGKSGLPQTETCAAAKRAVDSIRAALGELGYGQLGMGVMWGSADQKAYKQFVTDHGLQPSAGMPTEGHLAVMDELLSRGAHPGPETPVSYEKVGGEYVTTKTAASGMGLKGMAVLGLIGLAVVGGMALVKGRKKGASSRAMVVASR